MTDRHSCMCLYSTIVTNMRMLINMYVYCIIVRIHASYVNMMIAEVVPYQLHMQRLCHTKLKHAELQPVLHDPTWIGKWIETLQKAYICDHAVQCSVCIPVPCVIMLTACRP